MVLGGGETELELGLPAGETVEDGEWVLAIFELGRVRRATSAAARGVLAPDGARLIFEPRDWRRLADFALREARQPSVSSQPPAAPRGRQDSEPTLSPDTSKSAGTVPPPRMSSGRPPVSGATVLLVDDDPDIREVVTAMLEAVGLAVSQCDNAEDALTRVRSGRFDLLVLDWNLPR